MKSIYLVILIFYKQIMAYEKVKIDKRTLRKRKYDTIVRTTARVDPVLDQLLKKSNIGGVNFTINEILMSNIISKENLDGTYTHKLCFEGRIIAKIINDKPKINNVAEY